MPIAPFGTLKDDQKALLKGLYFPMAAWPASESEYRSLFEPWLEQVADAIWPAWDAGTWQGKAATDMEAATRAELEISVRLYQGGGGKADVLEDAPDLPHAPPEMLRTHKWHYQVEDARWDHVDYRELKIPDTWMSKDFLASKNGSANYLIYDPDIDSQLFKDLFLIQSGRTVPPLYDIKQHFQRPRPWSAAMGLGVDDYRWITAHWNTHTGLHPSLLSGHCIQGILGGCNVLDNFIDSGGSTEPSRIRAVQQYMVDWGDRRVFSGVHYMTDNIASWTLARRLIPRLFKHPQRVEELAVQAITRHSRVFSDIVRHFDSGSPARAMLLADFPEAAPSS